MGHNPVTIMEKRGDVQKLPTIKSGVLENARVGLTFDLAFLVTTTSSDEFWRGTRSRAGDKYAANPRIFFASGRKFTGLPVARGLVLTRAFRVRGFRRCFVDSFPGDMRSVLPRLISVTRRKAVCAAFRI